MALRCICVDWVKSIWKAKTIIRLNMTDWPKIIPEKAINDMARF